MKLKPFDFGFIVSSQLVRRFPTKNSKGGAHSTVRIVTVSSISVPHICHLSDLLVLDNNIQEWIWNRNGTNRNNEYRRLWNAALCHNIGIGRETLHYHSDSRTTGSHSSVIRERLSVCFTDGQHL